jgi:hypothetical protein
VMGAVPAGGEPNEDVLTRLIDDNSYIKLDGTSVMGGDWGSRYGKIWN